MTTETTSSREYLLQKTAETLENNDDSRHRLTADQHGMRWEP